MLPYWSCSCRVSPCRALLDTCRFHGSGVASQTLLLRRTPTLASPGSRVSASVPGYVRPLRGDTLIHPALRNASHLALRAGESQKKKKKKKIPGNSIRPTGAGQDPDPFATTHTNQLVSGAEKSKKKIRVTTRRPDRASIQRHAKNPCTNTARTQPQSLPNSYRY